MASNNKLSDNHYENDSSDISGQNLQMEFAFGEFKSSPKTEPVAKKITRCKSNTNKIILLIFRKVLF